MGNLMISHILFNVFSKYNIGSFGFRKILAILITVLIFGLLYLTVRFTGMVIPNYTRNLVMLATVDLAGFLFLMWKRPKEPPKEEVDNETEPEKDNDTKVVVESNVKNEQKQQKVESVVKDTEKANKVEEVKPEAEEGDSNVVIRKLVES